MCKINSNICLCVTFLLLQTKSTKAETSVPFITSGATTTAAAAAAATGSRYPSFFDSYQSQAQDHLLRDTQEGAEMPQSAAILEKLRQFETLAESIQCPPQRAATSNSTRILQPYQQQQQQQQQSRGDKENSPVFAGTDNRHQHAQPTHSSSPSYFHRPHVSSHGDATNSVKQSSGTLKFVINPENSLLRDCCIEHMLHYANYVYISLAEIIYYHYQNENLN